MFTAHPKLVSAYMLGVFGLVTTYTFINNSHEKNIVETKNSHEKYMAETKNSHEKYIAETKNSHEKNMAETKNLHEKYMLNNSRWWKRIF